MGTSDGQGALASWATCNQHGIITVWRLRWVGRRRGLRFAFYAGSPQWTMRTGHPRSFGRVRRILNGCNWSALAWNGWAHSNTSNVVSLNQSVRFLAHFSYSVLSSMIGKEICRPCDVRHLPRPQVCTELPPDGGGLELPPRSWRLAPGDYWPMLACGPA